MVPILTHFTVYLVQNDNVNKGSPYWLSWAMGFGWLTRLGRLWLAQKARSETLVWEVPKAVIVLELWFSHLHCYKYYTRLATVAGFSWGDNHSYCSCTGQTFLTVGEERGVLTKNSWMFSLPHFHFQFKSVNNISTILPSKLKICVYIWRLVSWLSIRIYFLTGN